MAINPMIKYLLSFYLKLAQAWKIILHYNQYGNSTSIINLNIFLEYLTRYAYITHKMDLWPTWK